MSSAEKTVMFALPNLVSGQLACVAGTAAGRSWDLSAGTFTIGRLDEHDMCLATEPGISKTHAKIIGQGDRYLIVDCESRNGTLVNGELVQKADLYDGDEVRICGCVLRFTQKGGPARPRRAQAQAPMPVADNAPTAAFVQPASMPPMAAMPMPMPVVVQAPPTGRVLVSYYLGGLVGSLLLGGAASAALIAQAPSPADPIVAPTVESVATTTPTTTTTTTTTPPQTPSTTTPATTATPPVTPPPTEADVVGDADAVAAVADVGDAAVADDDAADDADDAAVANADAADDGDGDGEDAPTPVANRPRRRTPSQPATGPFAASVDTGRSEVLRSKTGGRVKTALSDGAAVQKGTVVVTFEYGADAGELATLQDRVASLEAVESEEAKRELKAARAKLAALEGGQNAAPIVAGVDGVLQGMTATPGSVLKAGETIAKIADPGVAARIKVTVARSTRPKAGQKVMMTLKSGGSISGTVVAVSGRSVIVDPGSEPAENVESITF